MKYVQNLQLFFLIFTFFIISCSESEEMLSEVTPPQPKTCTFIDSEKLIIEELEQRYAIPFENSNPKFDEGANLAQLFDAVGNVHFVGLGEATHGTLEFYQMKDKLFRQLVEKKGFKAIIFEIPFGNALVVNDYVLNGVGTLSGVVDQVYYWTYNTKEVEALVNWMREYNRNKPDSEKIHFLGNDPQGPDFQIEIEYLKEYFRNTGVVDESSLDGFYDDLPSENLSSYINANDSIHLSNKLKTKAAVDLLKDNKETFVDASNEGDFQRALMLSHLIQHREYLYRTGAYGNGRDSLMAIYSLWWQEVLGTDSRVALWAHNGHVMDHIFFTGKTMGAYIKEAVSEDYKTVGFSFSTGTLNAFVQSRTFEFLRPVERQVLTEVPCKTTNAVLEQISHDNYYLIFDQMEGNSLAYFSVDQSFMQIGAGFNPLFIQNYVWPAKLNKWFDVLIHFDDTNASRF